MMRSALLTALALTIAYAEQPAPTPAAKQPKPASSKGYSGHGEGSISPEILAKYAPPSFPAAALDKIQAYLVTVTAAVPGSILAKRAVPMLEVCVAVRSGMALPSKYTAWPLIGAIVPSAPESPSPLA